MSGDPGRGDRWIVIPRWDDFEHPDVRRTSGTTAWIKAYTRLLSDDAYLSLTAGQRAVLHGLWLEYARARARLRLDTTSLTRRLNLRVTLATLEALNHAGFIELTASAPASTHASNPASLEVEEKKKASKDPSVEAAHTCPQCGQTFPTTTRLNAHLNNVHWINTDDPENGRDA